MDTVASLVYIERLTSLELIEIQLLGPSEMRLTGAAPGLSWSSACLPVGLGAWVYTDLYLIGGKPRYGGRFGVVRK